MANLTQAQILKAINDAATSYGVPPDLLTRMLIQESGLNPDVPNSKAGAIGIAQFMPDTAKELGVDPTDPIASIGAAAKYLADNAAGFNKGKKPDPNDKSGVWTLAAAAYNAGPKNVTDAMAEAFKGGFVGNQGGVSDWEKHLPKETQDYIRIVTGSQNPISGSDWAKNYSKTAGITTTPSTTTSSLVNADGSLRMPQVTDPSYTQTDTNGNTITDYTTYFKDLNSYYDAQSKKQSIESGPLSKYVDDVINDIGSQIQSGQLNVSKANSMLTNRLNAFKQANDVYSSDAFKYGAAPGATSLDYGNFHMPIQGGITVNPLQQALDQVNQGDAAFGGINIPQVPSLPQIMSGYQGQYGGQVPPNPSNNTLNYQGGYQTTDSNPMQQALQGIQPWGNNQPTSQPPPTPPPPPNSQMATGTTASSQVYDPSQIAQILAGMGAPS